MQKTINNLKEKIQLNSEETIINVALHLGYLLTDKLLVSINKNDSYQIETALMVSVNNLLKISKILNTDISIETKQIHLQYTPIDLLQISLGTILNKINIGVYLGIEDEINSCLIGIKLFAEQEEIILFK